MKHIVLFGCLGMMCWGAPLWADDSMSDDPQMQCAEPIALSEITSATENTEFVEDKISENEEEMMDASDLAEVLASRMAEAQSLYEQGELKKAAKICTKIFHTHPFSAEAPEALRLRGVILLRQHRYQSAFRTFQMIIDRYPSYPKYLEVVGLEYETAQELMMGKRHYFWGTIPGFKDRDSAIKFFQEVVEQAPYSTYAPSALMNVARLGIRLKQPEIAIEALEKVIDEYANSEYAPEAQLLLAKVYRNMVKGPDYDQRATEEAVNYYREFLILYPDSPLVEEAEAGLAESKELLAASKFNMGSFYYNDRQNPVAAMMYYNEAISIAPDSKAAEMSRQEIERIKAHKHGRGSLLDVVLGRYHQPSNRTYVEEALLDERSNAEFEVNNDEIPFDAVENPLSSSIASPETAEVPNNFILVPEDENAEEADEIEEQIDESADAEAL